MLKKLICMFVVLLVTSFCATHISQAAIYDIDPVYSSLVFKIKHLTGYNVGAFMRFGGLIEITDDTSVLKGVVVKVDTTSINTRHAERDQDLISERFFDVQKFPEASFVGKKVENGKLIGDLTLKGKTKQVSFDYNFGGVAKDQYGRTKVGLSARGMINRKDFGITFNKKLDNKQMLLGDDVEIMVELEGILQK